MTDPLPEKTLWVPLGEPTFQVRDPFIWGEIITMMEIYRLEHGPEKKKLYVGLSDSFTDLVI